MTASSWHAFGSRMALTPRSHIPPAVPSPWLSLIGELELGCFCLTQDPSTGRCLFQNSPSSEPCSLDLCLSSLPPILSQMSALYHSWKAILTHTPTSFSLLHYPIQVFSQHFFCTSNPSWHLPLKGLQLAQSSNVPSSYSKTSPILTLGYACI